MLLGGMAVAATAIYLLDTFPARSIPDHLDVGQRFGVKWQHSELLDKSTLFGIPPTVDLTYTSSGDLHGLFNISLLDVPKHQGTVRVGVLLPVNAIIIRPFPDMNQENSPDREPDEVIAPTDPAPGMTTIKARVAELAPQWDAPGNTCSPTGSDRAIAEIEGEQYGPGTWNFECGQTTLTAWYTLPDSIQPQDVISQASGSQIVSLGTGSLVFSIRHYSGGGRLDFRHRYFQFGNDPLLGPKSDDTSNLNPSWAAEWRVTSAVDHEKIASLSPPGSKEVDNHNIGVGRSLVLSDEASEFSGRVIVQTEDARRATAAAISPWFTGIVLGYYLNMLPAMRRSRSTNLIERTISGIPPENRSTVTSRGGATGPTRPPRLRKGGKRGKRRSRR